MNLADIVQVGRESIQGTITNKHVLKEVEKKPAPPKPKKDMSAELSKLGLTMKDVSSVELEEYDDLVDMNEEFRNG